MGPLQWHYRGRISHETAGTFLQASTAHCIGLADPVRFLEQFGHFHSIQSWTSSSAMWRESHLLGNIAPSLKALQIHITSPCKISSTGVPVSELTLGPALRTVDVTCGNDAGNLVVRGCPMNLKYMRLSARMVSLEKGLYESLTAKQAKPLVCAEHRFFIDNTCVHFQQTTTSNELALLFGSRSSHQNVYEGT